MLSSEGKLIDTKVIGQQSAKQRESQKARDRQQIFHLIDSLLSFEVCLHHQILPIGLEDNNLLLGMVYPLDKEALAYVKRILSYINCTMVTQAIAADAHRDMLSTYLNYKNTSLPDAQPSHQPEVNLASKHRAATTNDKLKSSLNHKSQVNQPQTLQTEDPQADFSPFSYPDSLSETTAILRTVDESTEEDTGIAIHSDKLAVITVEAPDILSPLEVLPKLPPKQLLAELLGRVLAGGIGRLYLERQPYEGRILWSDNGVLQSVIEDLPLSLLQGVLNELKRFGGLPVTTVTEAKQIEKECLYKQNHLLLRLRVMPGMYGEEATLQVLRGAALKFYQQQQLGHVSRDALGIAQQLSLKLNDLQQRLVHNPNLQSEQIENLLALSGLMKNLDQQIKTLSGSRQLPKNKK
ncbi:MAG: pilus assembly protein PilB [Gloeotrichia echinulata DVL01]|jgi:type II secretory ATPase GspE/PulE/Tfp pilus assembly ATPase PilB-like protein|nr:pilus assembly protein PilB [Gloeotrichia echinulata DEX184]